MQKKDFNSLSYRAGTWEGGPLSVIDEQAVTLTVNNEPWLTFMCTPVDLEALAVGFLYNEEIIETVDDIASVRVCPSEDNIDVWLNRSVQRPQKWARTSGCSGGKTSISHRKTRRIDLIPHNGILITPEKVGDLVDQLGKAQELYRRTGGVHTSALSDYQKIALVAEDIGRHNTLDKLAGGYLLKQVNLESKIILTTGRISSEMIQKAGRMGAVIVISRTSPSTLSVQMAEEMGVTLIGYARRDRFTAYSHAQRILSILENEKATMRRHDQ